MYSGIALSGLASLDCCIVSSFRRFIDEKSQMKAPRMSAYFAKPKTPPSSLLTIPRTGSQFSTFVMSDAIRFATMGTMHHIKMNASTLHNDVIERKRLSHSPNC